MKNKIKNFIQKNKKILLFAGLFIFFGILSFQIFDSFLAKGEEHNITETNFIIDDKEKFDRVALTCGDVNGDDKDEIVVIKNTKKPEIVYFDKEGNMIDSFVANIRDRVFNIASGDVDKDGRDEIALTAESDNSVVRIFKNKKLFNEFRAFANLKIGASVDVGDINGDGTAEIVVGAGKNGGPQVRIYDVRGKEIISFFAFNPLNRKGINVVTGNIDEDISEEIFISQKNGGQNIVRVYKAGEEISLFDTMSIYPKDHNSGLKIFTGDLAGDKKDEFLAARDVTEGSSDLKLINHKEEFQAINSETLLNLQGEINMDICDFKDSKAVVVNSSDNYREIKVIYKY